MNSVLLEMAVFADAPVDLTITSKAEIKNSSAAIHHIISYFECANCGAVKTKVLFRKQSKVAACIG
jgi:hypothetical protein